MKFLTEHIKKTADIAAGWTVGRLVIEQGQAYIELDNGSLVLADCIVEVKNGDCWQQVSLRDITAVSDQNWPAYGGMDARIKPY